MLYVWHKSDSWTRYSADVMVAGAHDPPFGELASRQDGAAGKSSIKGVTEGGRVGEARTDALMDRDSPPHTSCSFVALQRRWQMRCDGPSHALTCTRKSKARGGVQEEGRKAPRERTWHEPPSADRARKPRISQRPMGRTYKRRAREAARCLIRVPGCSEFIEGRQKRRAWVYR